MTDVVELEPGPLSGVRIVDLSRVIAGPYVGRLFSDMGAEVLKIEPPDGDEVRQIAPKHDRGDSGLWTFANVGKRSLSIDLQKPGASQIVLDLIASSQLVCENFRPGVLERLGLGWDEIHTANPRAVLVSINGFGSDSAWANRRAYAPIVHAVSGILDDQSRFSGQPVVQRNEAHADTIASLHAAVAALAALRTAEATGVGQRVEVPMFDAVLSTYNSLANAFLDPPEDRIMNPIYDAGAHGAIATAGSVQHVWRLLADAQPDLEDPTPEGADLETKVRVRHQAIEAWMTRRPSRESALQRLAESGIACAPVVSLVDAATGSLAKERQLLVEVDDRRGGTRPVVRPPARFSAAENRVRGPAPRRGEHNESVLSEWLGYDSETVRELEERGVLSPPDPV
ncbi:MAG: CoA transferase [bacterium]|nr:CoA transferase [bacterium]